MTGVYSEEEEYWRFTMEIQTTKRFKPNHEIIYRVILSCNITDQQAGRARCVLNKSQLCTE